MDSSILELINHKQKVSKFNPYIAKIEAKEILDSRGEPTIKARVVLKDGFISEYISIPQGKSKSKKETNPFTNKQSIENIKTIATSFVKRKIKVTSQKYIDKILDKYTNIYGKDATLAVSLACLKSASQILNLEPYQYIRKTYPEASQEYNTHLMFNIFNGGLHAIKNKEDIGKDKIYFQELMLNIQEETYAKALEKADNIYFNLKEVLKIHNYDYSTFGDEGGYSPNKIKNINFPNGFATTSIAFTNYLKESNIYTTIKKKLNKLNTNNLKELKQTGKEIRELILKTPLSKDFIFDLTKSYEILSKEYNSKNIDVAIRSSATAEDSKDNSFAGMHESFLNISSKKELVKKTQHAFASLFTDRAIDYRKKKGFQDMEVVLSVGVQKMVRSDKAVSGVIFTCDPETGFDDIIFINASYGLGENIVKGKVNADQIIVSKYALKNGYYPIIEKNIGLKQDTLIYSTKTQTKNIPTKKSDQEKLCLTDSEIITLAK
ncbi:MAG: PEP/pyruvate-binding domain-containing protein [Candidatus Pacebacteria bacterium]|nr:PEP/pyruvate-binding domain-containing protein [Candidatus Paceibacterota bacterium]